MACMKLGSKSDAFQRQGQAWFCTTGLPSDIVVEVGEMSFHLHKFPLLSRSGVMERRIAEASKEGDDNCLIKISDLPGGDKTFELVAKFCYGVKLELTASNVVYLRCAAEHLDMTEEYGEGNLVSQTETFLNQVVLKSWKDSIKALQSCDEVLEYADELNITKKCIESLAVRASTDPNLFGWPVVEHGGPMQSPGGSVLWNGISTGARPKHTSSDWWYEDASMLSFPLFKRLITAMDSRGIREDIIAGSLTYYTRKHLPGLKRRRGGGPEASGRFTTPLSSGSVLSEEEQKHLLEETEELLRMQKGLVPTKFFADMLRIAKILKASPSCVANLEKRIGMQLDQAALEDLVMPSFSHTMETLYDVDSVQRILDHFLSTDQIMPADVGSPCSSVDDGNVMGSPQLITPMTAVAKLIDGYLAEVAPDVNLKLPKFQALAASVPEYARLLDDGLYRAIDIYLKHHPWLAETERENVCRLLDCQKLSLEACTHAAQNERLPLRIIVQVLFFEQLQLRTSVAGCFLVSDNLDGGSRQLRSGGFAFNFNNTDTKKESITMEGVSTIIKNFRPFLLMIFLQFGAAGTYIVIMATLNQGQNRYVLIVYRNAVAALVLAPFAIFFERKVRPKMTLSVFWKIVLLGFLEPILDQGFGYLGMNMTSATYTSAIMNVLPSVTFIIAWILRMEKVKIAEVRSQAKIIGTLVALGGALVMTLYKGPLIPLPWSNPDMNQHNGHNNSSQDHNHWVGGTLLILLGCVAWSCFYVLQSITIKTYPADLSLSALICLSGAVQSTVVALVVERHSSGWAVGWDARLLAPLYTGIVSSGLTYYVQGMVMRTRGPVFVTAFNPLCMILVALLASFILHEQIHYGCVIGGTVIAMGLYLVVWGKGKDYEVSGLAILEKNSLQELPIRTQVKNDDKLDASVDDVSNVTVPAGAHR